MSITIGWSFSKRIVADVAAAERFYAAMGLIEIVGPMSGK